MLKPHPLFQPFTFFLGCYRAHWLGLLSVPLMLSRRTLVGRKSFPRAITGWLVDSGGFNELEEYGLWAVDHRSYAREIELWQQEIGQLIGASIQDWPCTIASLKRTGLTVAQHQERSVGSFIELRSVNPDLPIIPVLSGLEPSDFLRHADLFHQVGVEVDKYPLVGIGGIAKRQTEPGIVEVVRRLAACGIKLHGFGVKTSGLKLYADSLASSDSLAWSYQAWQESRHGRRKPATGCTAKTSCKSCVHYALGWREKVIETARRCSTDSRQFGLWPTGDLPHYKELPAPPWADTVREFFAQTFPPEMLPAILAETKRNFDIIAVAHEMVSKEEETDLVTGRAWQYAPAGEKGRLAA